MDIALRIIAYALFVGVLAIVTNVVAWRHRHRSAFSAYAFRGGAGIGALSVLSIGTAEAGLVGFYPIAIAASAIIWAFSALVGAVLALALLTVRDMLGM